jgi:3-oxoacyl-[acyl-carrier-protein] synthase-3
MARIAQIVSTAHYLPEHIVTNAELTARFAALGRPDVINKLGSRTGINQRFYVPKDWVTSDLALAAAKEALKRAGRKPEDVNLVILGTTSPDCIAPNTAVVLQHKLGAKNAGTFDVDCACAAFPAQVAIAAGLIATNAAMKTVLLVGVDMIHRLSDPNDPGIFFWGDGAGAAVMEGGDREGFIGAALQADGTYAFGWGIAAGGTFEPASIDAVKGGRTQMRREAGNYPASVNEDNWPRLFKRLSAECGFTADQVDQLIFTQISKPSIAIAAERCNVPIEKCHTIMQKWGYTGSACIPMALDDAIELGKIKRRGPRRHDQFGPRLEPSRGGHPHDDVDIAHEPRAIIKRVPATPRKPSPTRRSPASASATSKVRLDGLLVVAPGF